MKYFIIFHSITIMVAFVISFFIFFNPKGTPRHRVLGRIFALSMLVSLAASFFIQSSGHFSWIHILSVLGIYWITKAIWAARRKKAEWRYVHASNMISAYISIIIAGVGVLGRHVIFPGNTTYGFIISAIVAVPTIILARKMMNQTLKNK